MEDLVKLRMTAGDQDQLTGKIDEVLAQRHEEITWRGQTIPVKNEKVRVFILRSQQSSREIEQADSYEEKMKVFTSLLMDCQDAQQIIKDELKADGDKGKRSQKNEAHVANMEFLLSYISFIRLSKTIDRNLLMVESRRRQLEGEDDGQMDQGLVAEKGEFKATKPDDLVHLYDTLLQNVTDLSEVQGIDDIVSQELAAQTLAFRAHRCFYIAETHRIAKKWAEATGLYDRCITRATTALDHYAELSQASVKDAVSDLHKLLSKAKGKKCATHASAILETLEVEEKMEETKLADSKVPIL
jgi:signal recognition particle subunit SRP68